MPEDRQPKQLGWNVKPGRGMQRKTWGKVIDGIFLSLSLDRCEWLKNTEWEDSSFIPCVQECISQRECRKFKEGLVTHETFGKNVEFRKFLDGVSDAGTS